MGQFLRIVFPWSCDKQKTFRVFGLAVNYTGEKQFILFLVLESVFSYIDRYVQFYSFYPVSFVR